MSIRSRCTTAVLLRGTGSFLDIIYINGRITVAFKKNRKEPSGNKLGRLGMGEANNDESNFILTAIQPYWNELAISRTIIHLKKKKSCNFIDSLGKGLRAQ